MNQWYFGAFSLQTSNSGFICDILLHPSVLTVNLFLRYKLPLKLFGLFLFLFFILQFNVEGEWKWVKLCKSRLKVFRISYSADADVSSITSQESQKHSTAVFSFKTVQLRESDLKRCFHRKLWQSSHDSISESKKRTRCGPSRSWKASRLIRRHLRQQKADSSSLRHRQEGRHDCAFISASSGVGQQRDASW